MQIILMKLATVSVKGENDIAAEHHNWSEDYDVIKLVIKVNLEKVSWLLSSHGV
jgi:hypothetical protein